MRLLAVRLSALGDVIHTIPAVLRLKVVGNVSWVVEAPYAELVEIVADVTPVPVRLKRFSRREIAGAWHGVRGFAVAVDFQGNMKSAAVTRASGAPVRFGFDREAVRESPAQWFYTNRVAVDRSRHVIDWNLQLAAAVAPNAEVPRANWDEFAADPEGKLRGLTQRVVLLPGAGRPEKQWPIERFREVVAKYRDAVVAWGPGERELAEAIGGTMAPPTNLRELAYLLQHAAVVVGADTGPLHLAAAFDTPCVGLYAPTDPKRNGPYGQRATTIDRFPAAIDVIEAHEVIDMIGKVLR